MTEQVPFGLEYITPFCANCMGGIHFPSDARFRPLFGVHPSPLEPICVGGIFFPPRPNFGLYLDIGLRVNGGGIPPGIPMIFCMFDGSVEPGLEHITPLESILWGKDSFSFCGQI